MASYGADLKASPALLEEAQIRLSEVKDAVEAFREKLTSDPDTLDRLIARLDKIDKLKKKYGGYEIPKKFIFLTEPFTLENGMVTQTMKLKRRVIMERYQTELDMMYKK